MVKTRLNKDDNFDTETMAALKNKINERKNEIKQKEDELKKMRNEIGDLTAETNFCKRMLNHVLENKEKYSRQIDKLEIQKDNLFFEYKHNLEVFNDRKEILNLEIEQLEDCINEIKYSD